MSNQLQRLLLERAGDTATISSSTKAEWASATFNGHRHQVCLMFTDKEHARLFVEWVDDDSKNDINLIGCLLAEMMVVEEDEIEPLGHSFITVEALTLNN